MKKLFFYIIVFSFFTHNLLAQQGVEQGINQRIQPPLQPHDISQRLATLEQQLISANREVDFWRNARFYKDRKKERMRKEKLVYWSQRTVEIRNEMTRIKQDRSYYQHKKYGDKRYYYIKK